MKPNLEPAAALLVLNRTLIKEYDLLSEEEQITLAADTVLAYPQGQLNQLKKLCDTYQDPKNDTGFIPFLKKAIEVLECLYAVIDSNNQEPHSVLLSKEFNADLFNEFNPLCKKIAEKSALTFAENLAVYTPAAQSNVLLRNIRAAFSGTLFREYTIQALLANQLLQNIKGDRPDEVFSAPFFNAALFKQFPNLVIHHLAGQEQNIAQKLTAAPRGAYGEIMNNLLLLIHDGSSSPFVQLYNQFMQAIYTGKTNEEIRIGKNRNVFLNASIQPVSADSERFEENSSLNLKCV